MSFLDDINYLTDVDKIPRNGRVYIYGDGMMGGYLTDLLEAERPDVEIAGYVNSFADGSFRGRPMVKAADFVAGTGEFDMVILTPLFFTRQILEQLKGVARDKVFVNMVCDCGLHSGYTRERFRPDPDTAAAITEKLVTQEDRANWQALVSATSNRDVSPVFRRFFESGAMDTMHYMEHVTLPKGGVVIEGGVCIGDTTARFAHAVGPTGRVFGFDPLGDRYARDNLDKLTADDAPVEVFQAALWNEKAELVFDDDGSATKTTDGATGGEKVQAVSIDGFVAERGLERVDFIKLDVEGAEPRVLEGARDTLLRHRPVLAISIYHGVTQYYDIPRFLMGLLPDYEYHLNFYSPEGLETVLYGNPPERL